MTLEELLQRHFKCKKPFLKRKKVVGYWTACGEPEPDYTTFTSAGGKAYSQLTSLLYTLESLLGRDFDANRWISILDGIAREEDF